MCPEYALTSVRDTVAQITEEITRGKNGAPGMAPQSRTKESPSAHDKPPRYIHAIITSAGQVKRVPLYEKSKRPYKEAMYSSSLDTMRSAASPSAFPIFAHCFIRPIQIGMLVVFRKTASLHRRLAMRE